MSDRWIQLRLPAVCVPILIHATVWLTLSPHHTHLTASVEADFPRYAALALIPIGDVGWDGFAPCGYPFLLRIGTALTGDIFRSGLILSALGGAWFLAALFGLARRCLPVRASTFFTSVVALNWLFVHNSHLAGTDMLWAAAVLTAVHCALSARRSDSGRLYAITGAVLGFSYLLRYATLAIAPSVLLLLLLDARGTPVARRLRLGATFAAGFTLLALPQLWLAISATGNPFASNQAKNVWFGIFGERDWVRNWQGADPDISLFSILREHPGPFLANVARNLGEFLGMCLTWPLGHSPRGVPVAMPLLAATSGLVGAFAIWRSAGLRRLLRAALRSPEFRLCAGVTLLYAVAVSMTFWMARFFLPAFAMVTLAGAVVFWRIVWPYLRARPLAPALLLWIVPVFLLSHSISAYDRFIEHGQQPIEQVRVALIVAGVEDEDVVVTTTRQHYDTSLPWTFVQLPLEVDDFEDLQQQLAAADAKFFLIEERYSPTGQSYRPALDILLVEPYSCPFLEPFYVRTTYPRVALFHAR